MSDKKREERALKAITVTGSEGLERARSDTARELVASRIHELLAQLEAEVLSDGADPGVLAAIERERRRLYV